MAEKLIPELHTPLVQVEGVWVKLEYQNPSGSVKDRVARHVLTEALRSGRLREGSEAVEPTSGNAGIALAFWASKLGLQAVAFLPENMTEERQNLLRRHGGPGVLTANAGRCGGGGGHRREPHRGRRLTKGAEPNHTPDCGGARCQPAHLPAVVHARLPAASGPAAVRYPRGCLPPSGRYRRRVGAGDHPPAPPPSRRCRAGQRRGGARGDAAAEPIRLPGRPELRHE